MIFKEKTALLLHFKRDRVQKPYLIFAQNIAWGTIGAKWTEAFWINQFLLNTGHKFIVIRRPEDVQDVFWTSMYAQFTSCVQWGKFRYCNFIPPDIDSLTSGKETEVVPWFISKSDGSERCLSSFSDLSWLELFPESCLFKGTLRLRWIENGLVPELNNYHFD